MPMNPIQPGLRTIHYWGVSTGKAQINVNQYDELHVPDNVAEQLMRDSSHFKDGPAPPRPVEDEDETPAVEDEATTDEPETPKRRRKPAAK